MSTPAGRLIVTLFCAMPGALIGLFLGLGAAIPNWPSRPTVLEYPLPHHIPKYPGGVSLRFAMVHDVLHERYPRHGEAYYRERNRLCRAQMKKHADAAPNAKPDDAYLALFDDLGAGLDFLKQHDEAVRVLREKLTLQESAGFTGRQLYTTYANLGTFLIHGNFRTAQAGDAAAKDQLREGLAFIHKSIEVNPEAHFGREIWQAATAEFLLAAMDKPELLLHYDMVGNALERPVDPQVERSLHEPERYAQMGGAREVGAFLRDPGGESRFVDAASLRRNIKRVGAEEGWNQAAATSHKEPVPFDEPTLGIIGMWRLGGGANPHFALALGQIMLRVGQRYIAWSSYERAATLANRFWPDPAVQAKFIDHCRQRQALIESQLPAGEREPLRPRFQAELRYGQDYQKAYQDYEAARIRQGASLDDPHFHDAFFQEHGTIASPQGQADRYLVEATPPLRLNVPAIILCAGLSAFLAACLQRLRLAQRGKKGAQLD